MTSIHDDRGGEATRGLLGAERRWSAGTPPKDVTGWAITAILISLLVVAASWRTLSDIHTATVTLKVDGLLAAVILVICGLAVLPLLWPARQSWRRAQAAKTALAANDLTEARVATASSREYAYYTFGFSA